MLIILLAVYLRYCADVWTGFEVGTLYKCVIKMVSTIIFRILTKYTDCIKLNEVFFSNDMFTFHELVDCIAQKCILCYFHEYDARIKLSQLVILLVSILF